MTELQKQKQRKENILKLKKIGFWTINIVSYICAFLFVLLLIISLASPKQSNNTTPRSPNKLIHNVNDIQLVERQPNNVSYDSSLYTITFTAEELLNNPFTDLAEYFLDASDIDVLLTDTTITYDGDIYSFDVAIEYTNSPITIKFDYTEDYYFYLIDNDEQVDFVYGFTWNLTSESYSIIQPLVASAIGGDDITSNIFDTLSSVLTNFINTINNGVNSVISLFWDSEELALTTLGGLTTIVVGVSVCFFLFRLLIGLIRLRG